jgi:hypothetical protein
VVIKKKLAGSDVSVMNYVIQSCISRFCTDDKAEEINTFFGGSPSWTVGQCVEKTRAAAKSLEAIEKSNLSKDAFWSEIIKK